MAAASLGSGRRLRRFTRTERAVHWVHAAAFLVLLASGLALYLPSLAELVGRRPLLKTIHVYTAVAWIVALLLIVVAGDRRSLRQTMHEIDIWDRDDRDWLKRRGSPQGRLNAGQKLNAIVTASFALLFAVTGVLLWYGERNTRFRFADTILIHDWLMYVSFLLFVGHLYLSLIHPTTRHALNGMTRGWVDERWALEHHRKWAEATAAQLESRNNSQQPYGNWGMLCAFPPYQRPADVRAKSAFAYRYHNGSDWPYLDAIYAEERLRRGLGGARYALVRWWEVSLANGWAGAVEYYSPPFGRGSLLQGWSGLPAHVAVRFSDQLQAELEGRPK